MAKQILTAREVVAFGTLGDNIPFSLVNQHLLDAEMLLARKVIGYDFFQVLLSDVIEEDLNARPWDKSEEYDTGEIVSVNGITWSSTIDANTEYPTEENDWELSSRFSNPGYTDFYELHLRPYLVAVVSSRVLPHLQPVGNLGMLNINTELGESSSSLSLQSFRQGAIKHLAQERLGNLVFYVLYQKQKKDSKLFDDSLIIRCPQKVKNYLHENKRRFYFANDGDNKIDQAGEEVAFVSQDVIDKTLE